MSAFNAARLLANAYTMPEDGEISVDIARVMKKVGEGEFANLWRQEMKEDAPLEEIRHILVLNCINTFSYYNVWDAQTCTRIGMLSGRLGQFGRHQ